MQTMVKDEADALVEWIEYHLLLGVDHFYIYDNNRLARQAEALTLPTSPSHLRQQRQQRPQDLRLRWHRATSVAWQHYD